MGFALPAELQARIYNFPPHRTATLPLYTFLLKKQEEIHRKILARKNVGIRFMYFTYAKNVIYLFPLRGCAAPDIDIKMIGELLL